MNNIGETLKKFRIKSKISVKEISDILIANGFKASEKTIYSWESGNSQPTPDAFLLLCEIYKISNILMEFGYEDKNDNILKSGENTLIKKYRIIDNKGKHTVDTVLEMEYNRCNNYSNNDGHLSIVAENEEVYLVAAHNDNLDDPEELEKVRRDLNKI